MTNSVFPFTRRRLLAGLGATVLGPAVPSVVMAQSRDGVTLHARTGTISLRPGGPDTAIWVLGLQIRIGKDDAGGDGLKIALSNELPIATVLNWYGIDGFSDAEPLTAKAPLAAGGSETFQVPSRQAGTFFYDLRLLGDGQERPSRPRALVIGEKKPVTVDHDETILIEDWRLRPDGSAIAPGVDPKDTTALFTVNARASMDIRARTNERLRLRFINACQRNGIALKIEDHDVRVMAIDSQPCEPFLARNGQLVLAPGTRIDAFVDAARPPGSTSSILLHDGTEPRPIARLVYSSDAPIRDAPLPVPTALPSNGLPAQLDLRNALRIDLTLGGAQTGWVTPATFAPASAPAFRAKPGRTVVLALTNRAAIPTVFHLHGHHFRLLDRLDDGWKPFWLDTLAIEAGQTQRIAFAAEYAGRWLIESMATD
ncbi:MAG TPA: multicopper oxidase domain-containing protein, partial [Bradyrhizobium sp.]|nr:multicopper oxidase domain-containing protein [Bradyrhizobium sp.]